MTLSNTDIFIRLATAAALGSVIGFERERLHWTAGIRTHMLVAVGACLIMIVSSFGFNDVIAANHIVLDPSRVAAQVVSGIGFLGAGAILARNEIVRGLTTAASIWSVAAIGLAVGGGLYFAAVASTVVILIILAGIKPLEKAYRLHSQSCRIKVEATRGSLTPEVVKNALQIRSARIKRFVATSGKGKNEDITMVISRVSPRDADLFTAKIKKLAGVERVNILARQE